MCAGFTTKGRSGELTWRRTASPRLRTMPPRTPASSTFLTWKRGPTGGRWARVVSTAAGSPTTACELFMCKTQNKKNVGGKKKRQLWDGGFRRIQSLLLIVSSLCPGLYETHYIYSCCMRFPTSNHHSEICKKNKRNPSVTYSRLSQPADATIGHITLSLNIRTFCIECQSTKFP